MDLYTNIRATHEMDLSVGANDSKICLKLKFQILWMEIDPGWFDWLVGRVLVSFQFKIQNLKFGFKKVKIDRFCQKLEDFSDLLNDFSGFRFLIKK